MRFFGKLIRRTVRIVYLIFLGLLAYGIAMIVFRQAYGIELPNIVRWVIQHWPQWLNFHF